MKIATEKPISNTSRAAKGAPSDTNSSSQPSVTSPTFGGSDGFQASGELLSGGHEGLGQMPNLAAAFGSGDEGGLFGGHGFEAGGLEPGGHHFDIPEGGFFGGLGSGDSSHPMPEGGLFNGHGLEPSGHHFTMPEGGFDFQSGNTQNVFGQALLSMHKPQHPDPELDFDGVRAELNEPQVAKAPPSDSEVAIIESDFRRNSHGDLVGEVLAERTGDQAQNFQNVVQGDPASRSLELLTAEGPQSSEERVNALIESNITNAYNGSSAALEAILNSGNDNLRVVNQSAGANVMTQFSQIQNIALLSNPDGSYQTGEDGSFQLSPEGRVLFEGLGLPADSSPETMRAFTQGYFDRYAEIASNDPAVAEARDRHVGLSAELRDRGVAYVVASGNDQHLVDSFQNAGFEIPEIAQASLLANPHNITVGALGTQGTATPSDDRIWDRSSHYGEVDFLAPGENVDLPSRDMTVTGTSFAAPWLGGEILNTMRQHPNASLDEILGIVAGNAGPEIAGIHVPALR